MRVPGTTSAYAERVTGGYFLDIVPDRGTLAQYGVMIEDVSRRWRARWAARP